jgi:hypothetical protein
MRSSYPVPEGVRDYRAEADKLIAAGYRRTSNRYRIVSRIDRSDWVEILARHLHRAPADFYVPGEHSPSADWCDYYRRCLSADGFKGVTSEVFALIPGSGWDSTGYTQPEDDR